MDHMLDTIYGSTGVDLKILTSVSAVFDQFSKVGTEIGRDEQHRKSTMSKRSTRT